MRAGVTGRQRSNPCLRPRGNSHAATGMTQRRNTHFGMRYVSAPWRDDVSVWRRPA